MRNEQSGRCLDLADGAGGTHLEVLAECRSGVPGQVWAPVPVPPLEGGIPADQFVNSATGPCVQTPTMVPGTQLVAGACGTTYRESWTDMGSKDASSTACTGSG